MRQPGAWPPRRPPAATGSGPGRAPIAVRASTSSPSCSTTSRATGRRSRPAVGAPRRRPERSRSAARQASSRAWRRCGRRRRPGAAAPSPVRRRGRRAASADRRRVLGDQPVDPAADPLVQRVAGVQQPRWAARTAGRSASVTPAEAIAAQHADVAQAAGGLLEVALEQERQLAVGLPAGRGELPQRRAGGGPRCAATGRRRCATAGRPAPGRRRRAGVEQAERDLDVVLGHRRAPRRRCAPSGRAASPASQIGYQSRGGQLVRCRAPRRAAAPGRGRRTGRTRRRPSPPTATSATPVGRAGSSPAQPRVERGGPRRAGPAPRCRPGTPTTSLTRGSRRRRRRRPDASVLIDEVMSVGRLRARRGRARRCGPGRPRRPRSPRPCRHRSCRCGRRRRWRPRPCRRRSRR